MCVQVNRKTSMCVQVNRKKHPTDKTSYLVENPKTDTSGFSLAIAVPYK
jgi:hypothetical protein